MNNDNDNVLKIVQMGILSAKTISDLTNIAMYQAHVANPVFKMDAFCGAEKVEAHFTLVEDVIQLRIKADKFPEGLANFRFWMYLFTARSSFERWARNPLVPQLMVFELFAKFLDPNIFNDAVIEGVREVYNMEPFVYDPSDDDSPELYGYAE